MKIKSLVLWIPFTFFAATKDNLRFIHRWHDYSATAETCQKEAERIANEATKAAPEIRAEMGVGNMNNGKCRIELSYDYYSRPYCATTVWSRDSMGSHCPEYSGIPLDYDIWQYSSLEECSADVAAQSLLFETYTKVRPVIAHCFMEKTIKAPVLRIVGFGPRNLEGQNRETSLVDIPPAFHKQEEINATVKAWLNSNGEKISRVAYSPSHGGTIPTVIHYYGGPQNTWVRELFKGNRFLAEYFRGIELPSETACESARQEADSILTTMKGKKIVSFCAVNTAKANSVMLHSLYTDGISWDAEWAPFEYPNYDACQSDRQRVGKVFKEKLGKNVIGLFCGLVETIYRARVFSAR